MTVLTIVNSEELAKALSKHVSEVFDKHPKVELTSGTPPKFVISVEDASDYLIGYVDGIYRQYIFPVIMEEENKNG